MFASISVHWPPSSQPTILDPPDGERAEASNFDHTFLATLASLRFTDLSDFFISSHKIVAIAHFNRPHRIVAVDFHLSLILVLPNAGRDNLITI